MSPEAEKSTVLIVACGPKMEEKIMAVDVGRELALPFEQIIGGPLQSVVRASVMANSATADFITQIGLEEGEEGLTARMVKFSFERERPPEPPAEEETAPTTATTETVHLSVPLLTIVPVPYIRIARTELDFEVKVASQTVEQAQSRFGVDADVSGKVGGGFWGVRASLKTSYESKRERNDTSSRTATLTVHVEAVQDEIPRGLDRMLSILETAVTDSLSSPNSEKKG